MKMRVSRFKNPQQVGLDAGLSSYMGWVHLKAIRWEWRVAVYWTV
jgi:hypothetical protein